MWRHLTRGSWPRRRCKPQRPLRHSLDVRVSGRFELEHRSRTRAQDYGSRFLEGASGEAHRVPYCRLESPAAHEEGPAGRPNSHLGGYSAFVTSKDRVFVKLPSISDKWPLDKRAFTLMVSQ